MTLSNSEIEAIVKAADISEVLTFYALGSEEMHEVLNIRAALISSLGSEILKLREKTKWMDAGIELHKGFRDRISELNAQLEVARRALIFYQNCERIDDFQTKINKLDWIECQVTYKGPSRASCALSQLTPRPEKGDV